MTFHHLVTSHHWLSVKEVLLSLYPDQAKSIAAYENVFNRHQTLQPVNSLTEIILTEHCEELFDEEPYKVVSGKELNNRPEDNTQTVGIEFVPWHEWLGMTIEPGTEAKYTGLQIIAHCLFEMTFMGFDEDNIQQEARLLNDQVEELKNMTDEERKQNTKPLKEFLEELENERPNKKS